MEITEAVKTRLQIFFDYDQDFKYLSSAVSEVVSTNMGIGSPEDLAKILERPMFEDGYIEQALAYYKAILFFAICLGKMQQKLCVQNEAGDSLKRYAVEGTNYEAAIWNSDWPKVRVNLNAPLKLQDATCYVTFHVTYAKPGMAAQFVSSGLGIVMPTPTFTSAANDQHATVKVDYKQMKIQLTADHTGRYIREECKICELTKQKILDVIKRGILPPE